MFKNISIKIKLLLLVIIPLIALSIIGVELMYKNIKQTYSLNKLEKVVVLSTKISALVHETQKERGLTAGFLGSDGKIFRNRLTTQREQTDIKIADIKNYINSIELDSIDSEINNNIKNAINELSGLNTIRTSVTVLSIKTKEAITYYTKLNSKLLDTIMLVSKISQSPKITREVLAYSNFLLSKERAGNRKSHRDKYSF